jgi:signal transduction histidine kinase
VRNLISNAVKFTPPQGHIVLFTEVGEKHITINVRDTGIGIDPIKINELFIMHEDKSIPGTDNEHGTGLGLALCSDLIHKINGKISVQSVMNRRSIFTITLPA